MTRLATLLAAATLAAPPTARADGGTAIFLGDVEVESAPGLAPAAPLRAVIELHPSAAGKVAGLREWFPSAEASDDRATVVLTGRAPVAALRPGAAHRGASFLVDHDQPQLAPVREALVRRHGASATDEELARFVDGWIERKSLTRGIDVASTVAARREGDCSEHAVLLAATARLLGRASRVVIGIALVPVEGRLRGFGHAWAEIHDGAAWRTVDAVPLPPDVRYLPLAALSDEGPGYLGGAWAALSPIDVRRIALSAARARDR